MTEKEAMMILKNEMPSCGRKLPFAEGEKTEAYEIAIKAIEKQISCCAHCGQKIRGEEENDNT